MLFRFDFLIYIVAPLAGARIEISVKLVLNRFENVAPLAGARIEILRVVKICE